MANIILPKDWQLSGLKATDESIYNSRRDFVKKLGLLSIGTASLPTFAQNIPIQKDAPTFTFPGMDEMYPAKLNEAYALDRPLTEEIDAIRRNNFYEFIAPGDPNIYNVYKYATTFDTSDWTFEVKGMCGKKGTFRLEEIMKKLPLEERLYRFRCVERWAMAVPWTGISLASFLKYFEPKNRAKYVRFTTAARADEMVGVKNQQWYPWPYEEGLRMDEAMNELAFMATGIYGKALPRQNGAPMRLVVPWKYGYKNIKSIIKIEFIYNQPETFWNTVNALEYPFESNVDPERPHPRWSQEFEYLIPDTEAVYKTQKFNGYGKQVAALYG